MIVWKGYGILVPIATILVCLGMQLGLDNLFYKGYYNTEKWPIPLALSISAVIIWFVGRRLNKDTERTLVDPKTGEEVKLVTNHTFFWIKVEYWAPIVFILGLWDFFR